MALIALLLSTLFGAAGGPPALGDAIADKKAEASMIAQELKAQGERVSILAEQLDRAQLKATSWPGRCGSPRASWQQPTGR